VYVIVIVPTETPVTTPDVGFTVTEVPATLHVPPVKESERVIEPPTQTEVGPVIAPAVAVITLITLVAVATPHEPETVYEIVTVPVLSAVKRPAEVIVAIAVLDTDHTPALVPVVSVYPLEVPKQTLLAPFITPPYADTVTKIERTT
jgi:hypothetical protein